MQLDFPIAKEAKMSKYQLFDSVVLLVLNGLKGLTIKG